MTVLVLVNSLVIGGVLVAAAAVATRVGVASAGGRFASWYSVLLLTALVPVALLALPPVERAAHGTGAGGVSPTRWLWLAWLMVATARICFIVVSSFGMRNSRSAAIPDDRLQRLTDEARAALACDREISAAYCHDAAVPVLVGIGSVTIRVPRAVSEFGDDELRAILLHEVAHAKRRDDLLRVIELVAGAVLFFNPAAIYARRKLAFERELACDELASAQCGVPLYVQSIITFGRCTVERRLLAANGAGLVARVDALIAPPPRRRRAVAALVACSIVAACAPLVQRPVVVRALTQRATLVATEGESEGALHYGRGYSLFLSGEYEASVDEYQKAIDLGFEVESSRFNIASVRDEAARRAAN